MRREAERAAEHLVRDHGVDRNAVTILAAAIENSAGTGAADTESGHPGVEKNGAPQLAGMIKVRVECAAGARAMLAKVLREASGTVG